ncbi:DUF3173 family protein [Lactococcus garvieae]|uniref:DUF3173 family protein n=1 Tax=Lactococcus garvieae TaxID=1363 RepID=UPI00030470D5|nr:DUF3173 family protein [Lactococcus garvieae]
MLIKKDILMKLGLTKWQSEDLIRKGKALLVQRGVPLYRSNGIGYIPLEVAEELLGTKIDLEEVKEYA